MLLDEYLPDASGSSIISLFDGAVIVVSAAAEDSVVVLRAISAGAVNYVLKPFQPAVLVDRLHAFGRFWHQLGTGAHLDQTAVDRALQALRAEDSPVAAARKGRSPVTSEAIGEVLRGAQDALTAIEVARRRPGSPGPPHSATFPTWLATDSSGSPSATARPGDPSTVSSGWAAAIAEACARSCRFHPCGPPAAAEDDST